MIYYFSGTGNSKWAAESLAELTHDTAMDIVPLLRSGEKISEEHRLGLVFPIHAWKTPRLMRRFVEEITVPDSAYRYAVCTCGDDAGLALELLNKQIRLDGKFSVQMPNNYVVMFDTDGPEIEAEKIQAAKERLPRIAAIINQKEKAAQVNKGSLPWLKTRLIAPAFEKHSGDKLFYSTDECIACGLCQKNCPTGNISLNDGRPVWKGNCVQCLACLHRCPSAAIEYGKKTIGKGRYFFTDTTT